MTKDEIQFWMLIAFAVAFVFSSYKVYIIFNTPVEGINTKTQHSQLEDILINFLKDLTEVDLDTDALFELIIQLEVLQDEQYKNFNKNRFNQLLQQLFYTYEVSSLNELIINIHQSEQGTSKDNDT